MSLRLLEEYESAVMSCSSDRPAVRTEESKKKPRNADKFPLPTVMLRSREVAKMLGISQCTLWKWAKDGIIPHVCVGRSGHKTILYPLDELKAWLANQSRAQANGEKSE
jgi:excisionase family DNA binding protein